MESLGNHEEHVQIDTVQNLHDFAQKCELELNCMPYDAAKQKTADIIAQLDEITKTLELWGEIVEISGSGLGEVADESGETDVRVLSGDFCGEHRGFFARFLEEGIEDGPSIERIEIGHQLVVPGSSQTTTTRTFASLYFLPVMSVSSIERPVDRQSRELQEAADSLGDDDFAQQLEEYICSQNGSIDFKSLGSLFATIDERNIPRQQLDTYITYINKFIQQDGKQVAILSPYVLQPDLKSPKIYRLSDGIYGKWQGVCLSGKLSLDGEKFIYEPEERQLYLALEVVQDGADNIILVPSQHVDLCIFDEL